MWQSSETYSSLGMNKRIAEKGRSSGISGLTLRCQVGSDGARHQLTYYLGKLPYMVLTLPGTCDRLRLIRYLYVIVMSWVRPSNFHGYLPDSILSAGSLVWLRHSRLHGDPPDPRFCQTNIVICPSWNRISKSVRQQSQDADCKVDVVKAIAIAATRALCGTPVDRWNWRCGHFFR
jgi:hypothetical protein